MKIRNGFVSNSSSSSFVIGKYFMTQEQIKAFRIKITEISNSFEGEYGAYLDESDHYFYGEVDHEAYDLYRELLDEIGVGSDKAN